MIYGSQHGEGLKIMVLRINPPTFAPIRKPFFPPSRFDPKPGDRVVVHTIWSYYPSLDQFLPANMVFAPYQDEVVLFANGSAFITTYGAALEYQRNWIEQTKNELSASNFHKNAIDNIIIFFSPRISLASNVEDEYGKVSSDEEILDKFKKLYCVIQNQQSPLDGTPSGTFLFCGKAEDHELGHICKNIIGGEDLDGFYPNSKYFSQYSVDILTNEEEENQDECAACKKWALNCYSAMEFAIEDLEAFTTYVSLYDPTSTEDTVIGVYKSFDDAIKASNKCNSNLKWACLQENQYGVSQCVQISECCGDGYDTLEECECSCYDPPPDHCPTPTPTPTQTSPIVTPSSSQPLVTPSASSPNTTPTPSNSYNYISPQAIKHIP